MSRLACSFGGFCGSAAANRGGPLGSGGHVGRARLLVRQPLRLGHLLLQLRRAQLNALHDAEHPLIDLADHLLTLFGRELLPVLARADKLLNHLAPDRHHVEHACGPFRIRSLGRSGGTGGAPPRPDPRPAPRRARPGDHRTREPSGQDRWSAFRSNRRPDRRSGGGVTDGSGGALGRRRPSSLEAEPPEPGRRGGLGLGRG